MDRNDRERLIVRVKKKLILIRLNSHQRLERNVKSTQNSQRDSEVRPRKVSAKERNVKMRKWARYKCEKRARVVHWKRTGQEQASGGKGMAERPLAENKKL